MMKNIKKQYDLSIAPINRPKRVDLSKAWDFSDKACEGKIQGLLTHGQVRVDKDDMHPQENLINMLLTL
jgi:hypothetical protein